MLRTTSAGTLSSWLAAGLPRVEEHPLVEPAGAKHVHVVQHPEGDLVALAGTNQRAEVQLDRLRAGPWHLVRAVAGVLSVDPDPRLIHHRQRVMAHGLRRGKEQDVLQEIAALPRRRGEVGKVIRREQNYFAGQAGRMNYQKLARRGWPIASGPVESGCRTRQGRRKRPGQFWTRAGLRHLDALEEARDNGHWDELWLTA